MFKGYYQPTENEMKSIWGNGLITLDTNVLLSLYNVLPSTSSLYLGAMKKRTTQMWIPYQIASEFHRNVHKERTKQTSGHLSRIAKIDSLLHDFRSTAKKSRLQPSALQENAVTSLVALRQALDNERKQIAKQTHHHTRDELLDRIAGVFAGRVGPQPAVADLEEMFKEGAKRFDQKIPPGYEDEKEKKDNRKYGDYVLWRQLMDHAKEAKRDVIFVTDDNKADWWLKDDNKTTLAPRPELIQEFREETEQDILILNSEQFYYTLVPAANDNSMESDQVLAAQEDMKAAVSEARRVAATQLDKEDVIDLMAALKRSIERKQAGLPDAHRASSEIDRTIWTSSKNRRFRAGSTDASAVRRELAETNKDIAFLEGDLADIDFHLLGFPLDSSEFDEFTLRRDSLLDSLENARKRRTRLESFLRLVEDDGSAEDAGSF